MCQYHRRSLVCGGMGIRGSGLTQNSGSELEGFYFLSLSGVFHPLVLTMLLVMRYSNQLD
jgi:hypothetical protein